MGCECWCVVVLCCVLVFCCCRGCCRHLFVVLVFVVAVFRFCDLHHHSHNLGSVEAVSVVVGLLGLHSLMPHALHRQVLAIVRDVCHRGIRGYVEWRTSVRMIFLA